MTVGEFGPLVTNTDIDHAMIDVLRDLLPSYLRQVEVERDLSTGALPVPADPSYENTLTDIEFMDHRLPAVIVTTAETRGEPVRAGDGTYAAAYDVVVSSIVRGRTPPEARSTAALFEACVRRLMLQAVSRYQDVVCEVRWHGSEVAPVTTRDDRWLAAGIGRYIVYVDQAVQGNPSTFDWVPSLSVPDLAPVPPSPDVIVPSPTPPVPQPEPAPFDPLPLVGTVDIVGPIPKE